MEEDVFRALAHPVRRMIVQAALDRSQTFNALQQLVHRGDATLAMHLRFLRDAKVIVATRDGKAMRYDVNRRALRHAAHWLALVSQEPRGKSPRR